MPFILLGALVFLYLLYRFSGPREQEVPPAAAATPAPSHAIREALPWPEDRFWKLTADLLPLRDLREQHLAALRSHLESLSPAEVLGYEMRQSLLMQQAHTAQLWCAAYLIHGGCSDDSFTDFRYWLISRGRDLFTAAVQQPDSLVHALDTAEGLWSYESWGYVAAQVYTAMTGRSPHQDYPDSFHALMRQYARPLVLDWSEDDAASMRRICPQLYARCME